MEDTEVICKASNLEVALFDYFPYPTIEERHALAILNARFESDKRICMKRIEASKRSVCETV